MPVTMWTENLTVCVLLHNIDAEDQTSFISSVKDCGIKRMQP